MKLELFNNLPEKEILDALIKCCSSSRWAQKVKQARPFKSIEDVLNKSEEVWSSLNKEDWLEAFSGHPKIGDVNSLKEKYANTTDWAKGEQSGVEMASDQTIQELANLNDEYLEIHGYIFIVCATGKSADEMLEILKSRINNELDKELKIAAEEQLKITKIRLEKLL